MKKYDHTFHAFIQGIILLGFAMLLLSLILTGNIIYYIAPTMMPFIYFALVTFFLLGLVQVFRSTRTEEHEHGPDCGCDADHQIKGPPFMKVLIYSIFILPVVFGFVLPDRALDSSVAANRGIQFGGNASAEANNNASSTVEAAETSRAEAYLEDPDGYMEDLTGSTDTEEDHYIIEDLYDEEWFDGYYADLREDLIEEEVIYVNEDNYLDIMTVFDLFLDDFIGKELEITGFVFREAAIEDNQLVVARFSMTCCTADAAVYGTMVESSEAESFEDDTWVHVSGTIEKSYYNNQEIPVLKDTYIQEVDEPESPYVYPNF